jgi:hypothetical protein
VNSNESGKDVGVKPPNISEETLKEMSIFFMKTSIPRIIAEKQAKKEKENENE